MIDNRQQVDKLMRRIPPNYRIIMEKALDYRITDAVNVSTDTVIQACLLVLRTEFGFGAERLKRFADALQDEVDTNANRYDDAMAIGLNQKLHNVGVDYKLRGERQ